jgi:hypothetical protein
VLFGEAGISAKEIGERLVSEVLKRMGADAKACRGGSREMWNVEVNSVLHNIGKGLGYDAYPWLLDLIWWSMPTQRMILGVESEMDKHVESIAEDFEKLPVFKCPLKLLVFSAEADAVKGMAENYLQMFTQHVKGEEYLLVGFTASGPRCFLFPVPLDGKLDKVRFDELKLSKAVLRAA